jgi:hypothetical protein
VNDARPRPEDSDAVTMSIRALSDDQQRDLYEQISPYESMGVPTVGRDAAAEEFVRHTYRERAKEADFLAENPMLEKFMDEMKGYYATEVMPRSAGLPFYQPPSASTSTFGRSSSTTWKS